MAKLFPSRPFLPSAARSWAPGMPLLWRTGPSSGSASTRPRFQRNKRMLQRVRWLPCWAWTLRNTPSRLLRPARRHLWKDWFSGLTRRISRRPRSRPFPVVPASWIRWPSHQRGPLHVHCSEALARPARSRLKSPTAPCVPVTPREPAACSRSTTPCSAARTVLRSLRAPRPKLKGKRPAPRCSFRPSPLPVQPSRQPLT
ncbi:hypothetical protein PJL18_03814 [Paenarthrobacter nicotinovorans]|nr:hypothetical protein [Paenarthrobacter nicotinovorans]